MAVQEYADPEIQSLDEPIRDATLLKNLLTKKYTFDESDIHFLSNPSFEDINVAFEILSAKVTSDDLLLIFYAGHGFFDKRQILDIGFRRMRLKKTKRNGLETAP